MLKSVIKKSPARARHAGSSSAKAATILSANSPPSGTFIIQESLSLHGHVGVVFDLAIDHCSRTIATLCDGDGRLRRFALSDINLNSNSFYQLVDGQLPPSALNTIAVIGDGIVLAIYNGPAVVTLNAASGELIEYLQQNLSEVIERASAVAVVKPSLFVVGTQSGDLIYFSHARGRRLAEVVRVRNAHAGGMSINEIAVCEDVIATASADMTVGVRCVATHKKLATLGGHQSYVGCVAMNKHFIASGSDDTTIRLYQNGESFELVVVFNEQCSDMLMNLTFVSDDVLMSTCYDGNIAFTSMSAAKLVASVDVGFKACCAKVTADGRIACAGEGESAIVFTPPSLVKHLVREYGRVLSSRPSCFPSSSEVSAQASTSIRRLDVDQLETKNSTDNFSAELIAAAALVESANSEAAEANASAARANAIAKRANAKAAEATAAAKKARLRAYTLATLRVENEEKQLASLVDKAAAVKRRLGTATAEAEKWKDAAALDDTSANAAVSNLHC